MKRLMTLERDEAGLLVAECPAIPGGVSQGRTEDEVLSSFAEAMRGCLVARAARGVPLSIAVRKVEVRAWREGRRSFRALTRVRAFEPAGWSVDRQPGSRAAAAAGSPDRAHRSAALALHRRL